MKKEYHKPAGFKSFPFSVSKWAIMPNTNGKLVDKNGNEIFPIERGTVESAVGSITYVKRGKIVIYTIDFVTSSISAATSELATAPYFNKNMEFEGGAILRVANTPVGYACCSVTKEGRIKAIHSAYDNQVQFIGSVTVILE